MRSKHDKKIGFFAFYMRTFYIKEAAKHLKMVLFLSVIFTVAAIFTVINSINDINRKSFLANCEFDRISFDGESSKTANACYKASIMAVGKEGGNQADVNLFADDLSNEKSFFCEKNRLEGHFDKGDNTIWLTYNTAYNLDVTIGSKVDLVLKDEEKGQELSMGEYIVDGIMKPFGGDFEKNTYDEYIGFANVFLSESEKKKAIELSALYLSFDSTKESSNTIEKEQLFKKSKLVADYVGHGIRYIFPAFSILISLVVIGMEYIQYYKRGKRRFAVLNTLGVKKRTLRFIHFIVFFTDCLMAVILSAVFFRFTMIKLIGKYIPMDLNIKIMVVELLISTVIISLCIIADKRSQLTSVFFDDDTNKTARD